jgi:hypothetical protein
VLGKFTWATPTRTCSPFAMGCAKLDQSPRELVMRTKIIACLLLTSLACVPRTFAQGTAFTYQGQLNDSGAPARGIYDLQFTLYDLATGGSAIGATQTNSALGVSNGLFAVTLDFGAAVFNGAQRWLEIGVRTNGPDAFLVLSPRQALTATPYAITARNVTGVVPSTSLSGGYSNAVIFSNPDNSFRGFGTGLVGVNAASLNGLNANQFWRIGGNAGTTASNFVGTTDNQPLELRVKGQTALRLQPNSFGGPSVIAGSNTIDNISPAATIAGGQNNAIRDNGFYSAIGGGIKNTIDGGQYSVIAGGTDNRITPGTLGSAIGGGWENVIDYGAHSVIAGGHTNSLGSLVQYSVIGGGERNRIHATNMYTVIAGGSGNEIQSSAIYSTIGGGVANVVASNAAFAAIPGGYANVARENFTFAAGNQAQANHHGAFVWADGQGGPFTSTTQNQFAVRAAGGVRLATPALAVDGNIGIGSNAVPQAPLHVVTPGEGIRIQGQNAGAPNAAWMSFVDGAGTHIGYVGDGGSGDTSTYLASYVGNVVLYTPAGAALTAMANGEVRLGPSAQLRATAGEENLRIVRGEIAGNGIILKGTGFTATHGPITGIYTITFTTPFADRPTFTATSDLQGGGVPYAVMFTESASSSTVKLQARNMDANALVQSRFHFIAIGPR